MTLPKEKKCSVCKSILSRDNFYRNIRTKCGLYSACKECCRTNSKSLYKKKVLGCNPIEPEKIIVFKEKRIKKVKPVVIKEEKTLYRKIHLSVYALRKRFTSYRDVRGQIDVYNNAAVKVFLHKYGSIVFEKWFGNPGTASLHKSFMFTKKQIPYLEVKAIADALLLLINIEDEKEKDKG